MQSMKYLFACMSMLGFQVAAGAEIFTQLTPTTCPSSSSNLFTTGQQYVDPGNGVLQDSWSMLVRWQDGAKTIGNTGWISSLLDYNAGTYTGYTPPSPYYQWQRGYQPESQAAATPGVQLHCFDAGMILNSWYTPHNQSVVGGGFNDIYGYAWSSAAQHWAFTQLTFNSSGQPVWVSKELVLQGTLSVPAMNVFSGTLQSNGTYSWTQSPNPNALNGPGQFGFFAYLVDTTHPSLHPIALVFDAFATGVGASYSCPTKGSVSYDYANGVWFGSGGFCNTDISTVRYTAGLTTQNFFGPTFYRIHVTPQNWINLINRINSSTCGANCPATGYSTNPSSYKLQYMGVIAETDLCDSRGCGSGSTAGTANPQVNVGLATRASNVAAFWYSPN